MHEAVLEASATSKGPASLDTSTTRQIHRNSDSNHDLASGDMLSNDSDPSATTGQQSQASPGVSFAESDPRAFGLGARSSSPAKRSASERDQDEELSRRRSFSESRPPQSPSPSPKKPNTQQLESPIPRRFKSMDTDKDSSLSNTEMANGVDVETEQRGTDEDVEMSLGSSQFPPTQLSNDEVTSTDDLPSIEEQIQIVTDLVQKEVTQEGLKGYVVSQKWLSRVESRTQKSHGENYSKESREGPVGPVDNSDVIDHDGFYADLKKVDGTPFIPLKPGTQIGEDLQVLPQEAWDLVVKWYGVLDNSQIVVRDLHNTSPADAPKENFQYELFPPIFTIQKIPDQSNSLSVTDMKEKDLFAVNVVADRADKFQSFLKSAKAAANIAMDRKVRIWKILDASESRDGRASMPTPASSRSTSPVTAARIMPKLIMDVNVFTNMVEGVDRESLGIQDETNNEKYNGSSTVGTIGFPERQILVLEEQVSNSTSDEYVTDRTKKLATQHGLDIVSTRRGLLASGDSSRSASARRSPTPSGIMTRGRSTKKGRTRGCTGLTNLGNTCYMNSALQCLRSVEELTLYFLNGRAKAEINADNALGHNGAIAKAYEGLLNSIYEPNSSGSFAPRNFKTTLGRCQPLFSGYAQQDSQEFLSFLVDGLHEDLNRIKKKPYTENPESDDNTINDPEAIKTLGEKFKEIHRARNDSVAMDLFNGFYKNTMICPVCDKVSITFDPYSSVTLQLPFDSPWTHTVTYAPLHGPPVHVDVDMDRNSNIRMLKEYVGKRVGHTDASRHIMAEIYGNKFYKIFDDSEVLSESGISANDHIIIYELDETPTNWPAPPASFKPRYMEPEPSHEARMLDHEKGYGDFMAITVLHRLPPYNTSNSLGLMPAIITITREEAKDFDSILRKVLRHVATLTTRQLFENKEDKPNYNISEESDSANMLDEDSSSSESNRVQANSIQSEDGIVDVSMQDGSHEHAANNQNDGSTAVGSNAKSIVLDPSYFLDPALRQLFKMRFFSNDTDPLPTNIPSRFSDDAKTAIESRLESTNSSNSVSTQDVTDSEDELSMPENQPRLAVSQIDNEDGSDSDDALPPSIPRFPSEAVKQRNRASITRSRQRENSGEESIDDYLIRYGEGILLDWDEDALDALFEGTSTDSLRGQTTFKQIPRLEDAELDLKRSKRAARKKTGVTLEECFEETSKTEILSEDNTWYCSRCKEHRRASKTLEIWTAPDILMVHLKRFRSSRTFRDKMDIMVNFPVESLDLTGRVGLPEGKPLVYDLFAVDNHFGGLGGGHYTAFAKNFIDKKWYNYNDQMVSGVSPEHVVTKDAYLLFYRRRSDKPLGPQYLQDIVTESWSENDSGEEQRQDDSFSLNGSSSDSLRVTVGHQQDKVGGRTLGTSVTGGQHDLESIAKSALHDPPPPYATERELDEGIADMDGDNPDNPLPSYETDQSFIGPTLPTDYDAFAPTWSWDGIDPMVGSGAHAPPGSNVSDGSTHVAGSNSPDMGDIQEDRMLQDFGDFDDDDENADATGLEPSSYRNPTPMEDGEHHTSEYGFGVMKISTLNSASDLEHNTQEGAMTSVAANAESSNKGLITADSRMSEAEPEEHVTEITLSDEEDK